MSMELLWRARRRNTLITWPQAVDDRLERLVSAGLAAGENISRSQLLAALVVNAEVSPGNVAALMQAYRSMSVEALGDALASATTEDWPKVRHPGPRRGSRRQQGSLQSEAGVDDISEPSDSSCRDPRSTEPH
ncbi:hypothetical protein ACIBQ1_14200 [Nonomuraea sp. NPDC050153]|uniref:hypothetical protein n=1 Tax=Nonomuraea sp. NPDC050153 TaxID=3364359 RepID=UPI0037B54748